MPNPSLAIIPAPPEEQAVAGVLALLRKPGTLLANANVKIQAPEGDRTTLAKLGGGRTDNAPNNSSELPLIRLRLGGLGSRWETEKEHKVRVTLGFDLWAPGVHYGDTYRLWSAFHQAIYPVTGSVTDAIALASPNGLIDGLIGAEMTMGGTEPVPIGDDDFAQLTRATLVLTINIDT
jgi:hypothetical protein